MGFTAAGDADARSSAGGHGGTMDGVNGAKDGAAGGGAACGDRPHHVSYTSLVKTCVDASRPYTKSVLPSLVNSW